MRDVVGGHDFLHHGAAIIVLRFGFRKLLFKLRNDAVGQFAGALEFALALGDRQIVAGIVEFLLQVRGKAELLLFRLPAGRQRIGTLFQIGELGLKPHQPVGRGDIRFLLQRFALDLQLHDAAIEFVELFRLGIDLHAQARSRLIHQVDRLVGQKAVGDVAVRQRGGRNQSRIRDADLVVLLVLLFQAAQDRDRVLDCRLFDDDRLETTGERRVLLDMLAVFVERGRADAMQLAARKRRLQQVRGIHRAITLAGTDERVHLVDEQDDLAVLGLHLVEHALQPLFELAAIFRAGNQSAHVERHQLLVLQRLRHVAIDDAQRQAFGDRRLADAGFTDENGVVLGAAREHLDGATDFVVAADHGIEPAIAGFRREVAGEFLQRVEALFGIGAVGRATLADFVDDLVERHRRHAGILQRDRGGRFHRQRLQKTLDRDEAVAGLLRCLFGGRENLGKRCGKIDLAVAAGNLRQLVKGGIVCKAGRLGVAAGTLDQRRRHALVVVEQHFQHMLGRELLVTLSQRIGLRRLDETAHPLGVFFNIHK